MDSTGNVQGFVERAESTVRKKILAMLSKRTADGSVCPSEVARALALENNTTFVDWRELMPNVHAAVDELIAESLVSLTWKGEKLSHRTGPYRIRNPRK